MKKRLFWFLSAAAFASLLRFSPVFCAFWAERISTHMLQMFGRIGGAIPFSVLEWGFALIVFILLFRLCADLYRSGAAQSCLRFFLRLVSLLLAALTAYLAVWYPLCLAQDTYSVPADAGQLAASCERLIRTLNGSDPEFQDMNLPAKRAVFPFWMDACGISGFCSFFTGEALISPRLDPVGAPFTAVHECMHLRGFAHEGRTNIEAFRDCMDRGGQYAYSAELWALKYTLGILKKCDLQAYYVCRERMSPGTARNLNRIGGDVLPQIRGSRAIYAFSGIDAAVSDYEVLAYWLAAETAQ